MRAIPMLLLTLVAACAPPSYEQIQADFDEHVAASSACTVDADCTVIAPGCPLGCWVAVRADAAEECQAYARDLIAAADGSGGGCAYRCAPAGTATCESGSCQLAPAF